MLSQGVCLFSTGKIKMIGQPYAEESVMTCSAVSMQYRKVTDRRTGRETDTELLHKYRASALLCCADARQKLKHD